MKVLFRASFSLVFGIGLFGCVAAAQTLAAGGVSTIQISQSISPAQERIAAAKQQLQAHPDWLQGHNDLALAYVGRARETADPAYLKDAEQALKPSLQLEPDNFLLLKTQVLLLLGRRDFVPARELARKLNHRMGDDVSVYGYVAKASTELGDYPEAETAAQWMINLRRDNAAAMLTAAQLRRVYGDPEGALDFLNQAYGETSPIETEQLAWIANQIADVEIGSGKLGAAEQVLQKAEKLFPEYPYTQINLARLEMAQGRFAPAAKLLQQENSRVPNPAVLYSLAKALEKSGQKDQAKIAYADFERLARARTDTPDNSNRELILYYIDHAKNGPEALALAKREISSRHDVFTLDAYAWALYANGQYSEAHTQMEKALSVGIRDAQLFYHAGNIESKLNHREQAAQYFASSLQANPSSDYATDARKLSGLPPVRNPAAITRTEPDPLPSSSHTFADVASISPAPAAASFVSESPIQPFQPVPARLLTPQPTETDRIIRYTQTQVADSPKNPAAYERLGAAFFQKARETGDVSNYELAEKALLRSLDLGGDDRSATAATVTLAEVCMGEHRFAEALNYAQKALALGSGDLSPFALVGDAYTDMGEYDKATANYLKLQEPRVGRSYASASRLSYLKLLNGDTGAAIALMQNAIAAGSQAHLPGENLAWFYYELGEYYFQAGNAADADKSYLTALTIHPGDYRALAGLGRVRANQGKYDEAVELYQKAIDVVPMPIFVGELGDLYAKMGRTADARKQFQLVEYIGLLGKINQVLHNRDLALFYADHDTNLEQSLSLAKKEFEIRHDVYTWDALAWALLKNGKKQEAAEAIGHATSLHTKDALMMFHAGMIYESLGQRSRAKECFQVALATNPHFHVRYSEMAQERLASLDTQGAQTASRGDSGVR